MTGGQRFLQGIEGERILVAGERMAPMLEEFSGQARSMEPSALDLAAQDFGATGAKGLAATLGSAPLGVLAYSGETDRLSILTLLAVTKRFFAQSGVLLVDHADFAGVYEGIREALMGEPSYRFEELLISHEADRPGQGVAVIGFLRGRGEFQPLDSIPVNKNRRRGEDFEPAQAVGSLQQARVRVEDAVASWTPKEEVESQRMFDTLHQEFPDQASPKAYWHEASDQGFTEFFTWGHDQDFGFGLSRPGAMGTRHLEIVAESLAWDYLPADLNGLEVLDVGCWTGGDVLALAGMGARVTALEEHPASARAAQRLCDLVGLETTVHQRSLYDSEESWQGRFDVVYISGVIYHVTDPMLALRICFAYLKPGGRIVVETKASKLDGSWCEYAGTLEKGWNWYAPTLQALGRWLVDAGFPQDRVRVHRRPIGRLLAGAVKGGAVALPERAGFSRPGSWLEGAC